MKKKVLITIMFLTIGIFILCLILEQMDTKKFKNEFNALLSLREELIVKIKNSEIEIDENKFVILPEEYEQVATNGKVRVVINNEEETLIGFLYRSGFPDEEQYIFYSTSDERFIEEQIGESLCNYIESITENWYFIQYN